MPRLPEKLNRILVVKPSSLGDILHALPAIRSLVACHPKIMIDWVVDPAFAEILRYFPNIGKVIIFERKKIRFPRWFLPELLLLRKSIREEHYDAVVDMQGLIRSSLIARMAKSDVFIGHKKPREGAAALLYNIRIDTPPLTEHAITRNCTLLGKAFSCVDNPSGEPMVAVKDFAVRAAKIMDEKGIPEGTPLIGIAPGANWASKRFPPALFAEMMEMIAQEEANVHFAIVGTESDSDIAAEIIAQALNAACRTVNLCGCTTVGELTEILRRCRVLICNDSGPLHIAAAVGTQTIAFFGPTAPDRVAPCERCTVVKHNRLDCLECYDRSCPGGTYACWQLDIDDAAKVALSTLRSDR